MFRPTGLKVFLMPPWRWRRATNLAVWPSGWCGITGKAHKHRRFRLERFFLACTQANAQQHLGEFAQSCEAFIFGEPLMIAVVDLLDDHRNFKDRKDVV